MDFKDFERLVKKHGCRIQFVNKHRSEIFTRDGLFVSSFSVRHKKGAKDIVLKNYVKAFQNSLELLNKI